MVCREDHGHAVILGQPVDEPHEVDDALGVESGGRFVEHQDLRLHREDARDGDPLLLAA